MKNQVSSVKIKDGDKLLPFQPPELEVTFHVCSGSRQHLIVPIHSLARGVLSVEKRVRNRAFETWVHRVGWAA